MAIGDISLTAGMRANIFSLNDTSKLRQKTQERLATGKRVNSALDNPTNFFAARAHLNRAGDLSSVKDGIQEGVMNIRAANAGITAISSLIESAVGIISAKMATQAASDRRSLESSYQEILKQIDTLSQDSGYRGTNLLNNEQLNVDLGSSYVSIEGINATSVGLNRGVEDFSL